MKRILLIDGENLKGKIRAVFDIQKESEFVWHNYNFKGLFEKIFEDVEIDEIWFYFARIKVHHQSIEKSKQLIEEQRLLKTHLEGSGFKVIMAGSVRGNIDKNGILIFKEKGVDVRIGVDMVVLASDRKFDSIILGSSDSDLQPAIKEVVKRGIECIYLGFEIKPNKGMTYTTSRAILIRNSEVIKFKNKNA
ncbi:MAG: NYN domain-containing protein [Candidatus Paceibacterota bacterium]|jgi:uncharacterized LabA/DUF88 family protein